MCVTGIIWESCSLCPIAVVSATLCCVCYIKLVSFPPQVVSRCIIDGFRMSSIALISCPDSGNRQWRGIRGQDPYEPMIKNSDVEDTISGDVAELESSTQSCRDTVLNGKVSATSVRQRKQSIQQLRKLSLESFRDNTADRLHDPIVDWKFAIIEHNICQTLNVLESTPTVVKKRDRTHDGDS